MNDATLNATIAQAEFEDFMRRQRVRPKTCPPSAYGEILSPDDLSDCAEVALEKLRPTLSNVAEDYNLPYKKPVLTADGMKLVMGPWPLFVRRYHAELKASKYIMGGVCAGTVYI